MEYAPLHAAKEHVIRYNPEKDFVEHLFIHEMMHLRMNQQATKANRAKAVISSERTKNAFKKRYLAFMKKKHSHIPAAELDKVINGLADVSMVNHCLCLMEDLVDLSHRVKSALVAVLLPFVVTFADVQTAGVSAQ